MELLLSTGLRPEEIVRGQRTALWRQFALPICALLVANVFCLKMELQEPVNWIKQDREAAISIHVVIGVFLVLDAIALSWVGMWYGFVARKPSRAALPAMLRIVVLPGLFYFLLLSLLSTTNAPNSGVAVLTLWFVVGAGADILAFPATKNLVDRFRTIASEGYKRGRTVEIRPEPIPALVEVS